MKFEFVAMNKEYAEEMIKNWKYPDAYSIYDYVQEAQDLLDDSNWGYSRYVALDENNELAGELTIELFAEVDEASDVDGYVDCAAYKAESDGDYEMWIGFGLRPDLVGKGYGKEFVFSCINFAKKRFNYTGEYIRLAVADFNERAIKAYRAVGFEVYEHCEYPEEEKTILRMKKALVYEKP